MKKIVLLFITVFCMCCMIACGGDGNENTSAGDNKEVLCNSTDKPVVTTEATSAPTVEPQVTPNPSAPPEESVAEAEESPEESGFFALDTTRLKVAPFDANVLMAGEYYILYEIVSISSGEVTFETSDDVRTLTFGEDGRGCFWTDNEKGRPFNYEMDSSYSCVISFNDGDRASFGLYTDQGGALSFSEEGSIWLALYLENEVLWFY